nr:hypothetical protein [uncultured Dyadobacter sp.]
MKKIFLFVAVLFQFQVGWAQCPTPGRNQTTFFTTQAGIDAFHTDYPNCTALPGQLHISGADITDLSGLSQITSAGSAIIMETGIQNLTGLENLITLQGGYQILENQALTSLTGLGDVNELWISLTQNNALTNLTGMEHFTSINSLSVSDNSSLTSLKGLDNLTTVTRVLDISSGSQFADLKGIEKLTDVGDLWLQNVHSLADISALANLTMITGWLYIRNCDLITDLNGLSKVEEIGELALEFNQSLTSLTGMTSLRKITDRVVIANNEQLSECAIQAICEFIAVENAAAIITNNTGNCEDIDAVQTACSILPVTLTHFAAHEEAGQAQLVWETAQEMNSEYFEIQRSTDAKTWHLIGSVSAKGNSQQLSKYVFTDQHPASSINYYRLRSVDLDGSYSLSSIVSVSMAKQNQPLIYPVPTAGGVWIQGEKMTSRKADLLSPTGSVVKSWKLTSDRNYLEMGSMPPGSYLIRLEGEGPLRLVKE